MGLSAIILIILVIVLLGGIGGPWNGGVPFYGTGYYGCCGVGFILVVVQSLILLGRL